MNHFHSEPLQDIFVRLYDLYDQSPIYIFEKKKKNNGISGCGKMIKNFFSRVRKIGEKVVQSYKLKNRPEKPLFFLHFFVYDFCTTLGFQSRTVVQNEEAL